jgi:hypothetical protein
MPPVERLGAVLDEDGEIVSPELFDVDELINKIADFARQWSDDGVDLYPDGVAQFREGLYRIFGLTPPKGE